MTDLHPLLESSRQQHGTFSYADVVHAYGDDRVINRMVRRGAWVRVRHGAYTTKAAWAQLDEGGRHLLNGRAVLRRAHSEVVLSHATSLMQWGTDHWGLDLSEVHVTRIDGGGAGRREAGVCRHRSLVRAEHLVDDNGVRRTSPARTALEVLTTTDSERGLVVVNGLLHRGLTTEAELLDMHDQTMHWPGSLASRLVLARADGRVESVGESRVLHLCYMTVLPIPEPQVEVRDGSGRLLGRVDFAWPEYGVFLEFDGRVKYGATGEDAAGVVFAEKRREDEIRAETGWVCVRVTWADLVDPRRLLARLVPALRRGGWKGQPLFPAVGA